jgi:hypothetical protein
MPMYSAGGPSMGGGNVNGVRDAITQALMNVQNPQPRTEMPGAQPGMPGMGAPPAPGGIPPGITAPPGMPGAGGAPGGGMSASMPPPGGVMPPPMGAGQTPPPMPGGAPIGPPPRMPNMVGQAPIDPTMGTQMPGGPGQLGRY